MKLAFTVLIAQAAVANGAAVGPPYVATPGDETAGVRVENPEDPTFT